jgi:hypothetical protein
VFVNKPKPTMRAKIWLRMVSVYLTVTALTMLFWVGGFAPRFENLMEDKNLAFTLGRLSDFDYIPVSNRLTSIGG